MPHLARIQIFPFKSLDAQEVERATLLPGGGLEHDRRFALCDERGEFINGKRTPRIQMLRSNFDLPSNTLHLRVAQNQQSHAFALPAQEGELCEWLGEFFGQQVRIIENPDGGFPDDTESPGPTVISTATLETVGGWFGLDVDETRRRFRANLEIDGVEPFWEDRLVGSGLCVVRFVLGEVELLGTNPCQRCVVPTRSSLSGEAVSGFAREFAEQRRQHLPPWAAADRFDHFYRLAVNTRVARGIRAQLAKGDLLRIVAVD